MSQIPIPPDDEPEEGNEDTSSAPKKSLKDYVLSFKENWPDIKKKATGTQGIVWGTSVFGLIFLVVIIVQTCTPRQGNILYGMCREFLTLQLPFPHTMQQNTLAFYPSGVRIYYTHIDGFGEYQLEMVECAFYQDPTNGVQIENVFFNYVKDVTEKERAPGKGRLYAVKKEVIDLFNKSRSPAAMVKSEDMDLSIPDDVGFE